MDRLRHRATDPSLAILGRLARIFLSQKTPAFIFEEALREVIRLLDASSGSIILINPESEILEIEAAVGLASTSRKLQLPMGHGITGWVALHGKSARVPDVRKDPRYVMLRGSIRSELAVPLRRRPTNRKSLQDETLEVIGVLNVDSTCLDAFSEEDERLLETMAMHVSMLLQNRWLYDQASHRAGKLDRLLGLGQQIMTATSYQETLAQMAHGGQQLMKTSLCEILLLDEKTSHLHCCASSDLHCDTHKIPPLSLDNTLIGSAVRRHKVISVPDIQKSDPIPFAHRVSPMISLLAVPLLTGNQCLGAVVFLNNRHTLFSDDDIQIASAFANQAALAMERARLSEKLISTEEELRQGERLSTIGLLAAEVAHEIRNPLTVMKMLVHHLKQELGENSPQHQDIAVLLRKMDQMNRTVEQVLGLARQSEPVFEETSLKSLIEDLILLTRHKLTNQKVQMKLDIPPDLPPLSLDRGQMEQAILNIILNALHSMPKGGTLKISAGTGDSMGIGLWLEIRDSGIGMSRQQKDNLFRPFLTSRSQGTGLGMAIVNKIIQAHGGSIQVRSRPRQGTSIRISFKSRGKR